MKPVVYNAQTEQNLEAHQKVHNEISEGYECELCPEPTCFKQARNLRRHYVSYHNIVPAIYLQHPRLLLVKHKCDVCDKEFDRKDSLVRHKKMKTCSFLSCDYCKFMCSDKTSFIAHTKILHIKCDHCNFRIIFKRSLVRHIKNVHVNL